MFEGWYNADARPKRQHDGIVPTAQVDWEICALVDIFEKHAPRDILEIGSQHGGTLWYWMNTTARDAIVVSVDTGPSTWRPPSDFDTDLWYGWAAEFGIKLHRVIANSHDPQTLEHVKGISERYDFLFIDGDHTYEGARKDFITYGPLVRRGGMIAFHDLMTPDFSPHIQIGRLWREIQAAGYITQELRANASYGGIGIVYV